MSAPLRTRLLQMASQAFPIGGYSHSQGLEAAVEAGVVTDEPTVQAWIADMLSFSIGTYELACLQDMSDAWMADDFDALRAANAEFLASRESAELRSATVQMGYSMRALLRVLPGLPGPLMHTLNTMAEPALPCVWSALAAAWSIAPGDSMTAYLWAWAENQVLVAMKSVPIGQSAGQRILWHLGAQIEALAGRRHSRADSLLSNFAPALAILSARHEIQYSRLFRS